MLPEAPVSSVFTKEILDSDRIHRSNRFYYSVRRCFVRRERRWIEITRLDLSNGFCFRYLHHDG